MKDNLLDELAAADGCPFCGGPLEELGALGSVYWMRCRDCGMDVSADGDLEHDWDHYGR